MLLAAGLLAASVGSIGHAQGVAIDGAPCSPPAHLHCPRANCRSDVLADRGNVVLPKSNRRFFLDYPCDLKPGEAVTFVLSLHGAGVYGNWHRHYFPLVDYKDEHRLVIATPTAVAAQWSLEDDDAHLRRIVEFVYQQVGAKNIKAFWLVGGNRPFYRARETARRPLRGFVSAPSLNRRATAAGSLTRTKRSRPILSPAKQQDGGPPRIELASSLVAQCVS